MAGMPFSGKTEFVKKFLGITAHKTVVIDPKEYLPDDIDSLSDEEQKKWRIAAWEVCIKYASNSMHEPNDTVIILDTAAASELALIEVFTLAKLKGHYIVYIFMASKVSECRQRAGDLWIGQEAAINYVDKFKTSVPGLRKLSNESITIQNNGLEGLEEIAKTAAQLETIVSKHA